MNLFFQQFKINIRDEIMTLSLSPLCDFSCDAILIFTAATIAELLGISFLQHLEFKPPKLVLESICTGRVIDFTANHEKTLKEWHLAVIQRLQFGLRAADTGLAFFQGLFAISSVCREQRE